VSLVRPSELTNIVKVDRTDGRLIEVSNSLRTVQFVAEKVSHIHIGDTIFRLLQDNTVVWGMELLLILKEPTNHIVSVIIIENDKRLLLRKVNDLIAMIKSRNLRLTVN